MVALGLVTVAGNKVYRVAGLGWEDWLDVTEVLAACCKALPVGKIFLSVFVCSRVAPDQKP